MRFISYINGCCCRTHTDQKRDYFYVFHSSTGIIDKVPLEDTRYFNEMVTPDTWYGGVAKEYVGKGTYATQIQNGDFSGLEFDEDGHLQDINYNPYDGRVSDASHRFTRLNMYQAKVTPEKDTLYFIVEVYKEFFVQGFVYGYDTTTRVINEYFIAFAMDSGLYGNAKFTINGNGIEGRVANSITSNTIGKITVANINEGKAPRGYLSFLWSGASGQDVLAANTYYEIIPTVTTPDEVTFYGVPMYLYTADTTVDNIILSKEPFYYYIYHTANNTIERKSIFKNPTVNFPAIAGDKYGGTFTDYGGKGTVATALLNGEDVEFVDDIAQDDGTAYVGEDNTATALFDYNNALTEGTTGYAAEVGTIYYVKENPEWTLLPYLYFYPTRNSKLTGAWLVTAVDSLSYKSVTYYFKELSEQSYTPINLSAVKSANIQGLTLNANRVFKSKGCPANTGYIAHTDNIVNELEENKTYIMYAEAVTMDDVVMHGSVVRKLFVTTLIGQGLSVEDIPWDEAIVETEDV